MRHLASPAFWKQYSTLPAPVRDLADKNFTLLKQDIQHPSLQMKKVGPFWSVRIGLRHRALAKNVGDDFLWFWIGSHADYDSMIR